MKPHVFNRMLWSGLVLSIAMGITGVAEAKITVKPDFTGTLMITTPEGKVIMLDPTNPVPEILSQSTLEIFQGMMVVNLEKGDQASVGCLGKTGKASGPATFEVQCTEQKGTIKSLVGSIVFEEFTVAEGEEKSFPLAEQKEAPATAAGEEKGTSTDLGVPPVDSRSIQTSPSQ